MTGFPSPVAHRLGPLLSPRQIAVVGASEKSSWSQSVARSFISHAFSGRLVAVNRTGAPAHGLPGFRSCKDAGPLDATYFLVPVESIPAAMCDAIEAGVRSAVILTSGFAEVGGDGARLQEALVAQASEGGMTLIGPNSLGFADLSRCNSMTAIPRPEVPKGGVAVLSQSGAMCNELLQIASRFAIELSFVLATGNEAMIGFEDAIDYLAEDPTVTVIAVFAESVRRPERLVAAARRALSAGKPIVVLKVGTNQLTAQIAAAHTGSLVGDDRVFDAVCDEFGLIRVSTMEDLILTAGLYDRIGPITGGTGLVSGSGGSCTLAADAAGAAGLELPAFAETTQARLRECLPDYASTLNPLDITGGFLRDPDLLTRSLTAVGNDPSISRVVMLFDLPDTQKRWDAQRTSLAAIGKGLRAASVPGLLITPGLKSLQGLAQQAAVEAGISAYSAGVTASITAMCRIARWTERREDRLAREPALSAAPADCFAGEPLDEERAALSFLACFGVAVIPAEIVQSAEQAGAATERMGGKVVLKIMSPDIGHKAEVGGVRLGVAGGDAAIQAWNAIDSAVRASCPDARMSGMIVSPMRDDGVELIVGVAIDPSWGPVIAVGLDGLYVEVLPDSALARLPVSRDQAKKMLLSLRGAALLQGYRDRPAIDLDATADMIIRIGEAACALGPRLASLEVNPLLAGPTGAEALDALVIWADSAIKPRATS